MTHATVAVLILNWNGKDDTLQCLESVMRSDYSPVDVIVVDNGSSDDSVAAIRQAYPHVELIETGENLGYAGGNNVGIRQALERGADYIFILNNDTTVAPDTIEKLVNAADRHPEGAVFGPVIYEAERPEIIATAGERFRDQFSTIENIAAGQTRPPILDRCYPVDWVTGAAFFLRRSAIEKVGLFDERFFLVYEESDWCFRARQEGLLSMIVPSARVWHRIAASFGGETSPLRVYFSRRNRLLFAEKHLPKRLWFKRVFQELAAFIPPIRMSQFRTNRPVRSIYWAFLHTISAWNHPHETAQRRAVRDYFMRRFGDCPDFIRQLPGKNAESSQDEQPA